MTTVASFGRENNNFGLLRLLLACLVILSHAPEALDGNRSHEILTRIFGTLSFGELAVDAFFLVSGFLITRSLMESKSYSGYLAKRVLRIYPAFIVAWGFSFFIGLLAGGSIGHLHAVYLVKQFVRLVFLFAPTLDGAFQGLAYPGLNNVIWSVGCEFRCYLILIVFGALGVFKNRRIFFSIATILLLSLLLRSWFTLPVAVQLNLRGVAIFVCGSGFYIFRDLIRYTDTVAVAGTVLLFPLMFFPKIAETAFVVFGGYLLFWFAFRVRSGMLRRIADWTNRVDLSYGIYLYAWPIQNFWIWHYRQISPWVLFGVTLITSGGIAFASWRIVEEPFLRIKRTATIGLSKLGKNVTFHTASEIAVPNI